MGKPVLDGGDSENFMRLMNRALKRIEDVDKATQKANSSLDKYAKSFDNVGNKIQDVIDDFSELYKAYPKNDKLIELNKTISILVSKQGKLVDLGKALEGIGKFRFNRTSIESLESFIKRLDKLQASDSLKTLNDTLKGLNKGIYNLTNLDIDKVKGKLEKLIEVLDDVNNEAERIDLSNLSKVMVSATNDVKLYTDSIDKLNKSLKEFVKLSADIKKSKFNKIDVNVKHSDTKRQNSKKGVDDKFKSDEYNAEELRNRSNKLIRDSADLIFDAINNLGGSYTRNVTNTFSKIIRGLENGKIVSKASKDVSKYSNEMMLAGKATSGMTQNVSELGVKLGKVAGIVAASIVVLGLMAKAGKYAYDRNQELNKSLMKMGVSSNELNRTTSNSANNIISIKNTWVRIADDLAGAFEPFFDIVISLTDLLSKAVESITSGLDVDDKYDFVDNRIRGYTKNLENISGEPENKSVLTIQGISSSAKQSGFDNDRAANLAIGTYDKAIALAKKYGVEAKDVAKQLADAWLTGSEAAKDYGIVVDDQVLAGYMASKGVDIVNVQITDAMKQYYRYQLMLEEASNDNSDYMMNQIKQWKQLGFQIEATKGKLFSFDEVINLSARDSTIPTVDKPDVTYPEKGNDWLGNIPPIIPPQDDKNDGTSGVAELPSLYPVVPPLPGLSNVRVHVETDKDSLLEAEAELEELEKDRESNVDITIPTYSLLESVYNYLVDISESPWPAIVTVSIPSMHLAITLLDKLFEIASEWISTIDIKVVGQSALEKAYELLAKVQAMLASMGQNIKNTVANKVATVSSFKNGVTGKGKTTSVLSAWAPTSSSAYGGGLLGAIKADKDLWDVKRGLKESTLEGYTLSDINKAKADYLGYNLNPLNKNGAANLVVKSAVARAGVSSISGIGANILGSSTPALGSGVAIKALPAASKALALPAAKSTITNVSILNPGIVNALKAGAGFASGGIITKEISGARLGEGNKKEVVVPLETSEGINFLANAMREAGAGQGSTGDITVNLHLDGINVADDESKWVWVGEKVAEVIEIQRQRRGDLNYGSSI